MKMDARKTVAAVLGTFDTVKIAVSASEEYNRRAARRRARFDNGARNI